MSDVFGVSGRLMLDALVNGQAIEPSHVAELAKGKLRPKIPELTQALNGRVKQHHRKMIMKSLNHLAFFRTVYSRIRNGNGTIFCTLPKRIGITSNY